MAEVTRKSRMAIVKETTAGTPVAPSAGADFTELQDGFTTVLDFEDQENLEIRSSIAQAKPIQGIEVPTASLSHYLRTSGSVATAPQAGFANLLESAFGDVDIAATEYNTVSGSTTTVIKVDTGEGATFQIGEALLIKDATNGYSIRAIKSISSNDLTLGFAVGTAPGTGVDLGRAIVYTAAAEGSNVPLSVWDYRGNGAAIALISGARVTSMSMNVTAGELINMDFALEGTQGYFNPIVIAAGDRYLDFDDGGGEENAIIEAKTYKSPDELAQAIEDAMNALTTDTITVTYNNSGANIGKFTIASDGGTLSLLWNSGTNTANTVGDKIGFTVSADDTGATSYNADNQITLSSPYTPAFDSQDPFVAKNNEVLVGTATENTCFSVQSFSFEMATPVSKVPSICAVSGITDQIIQSREVTVSMVANLTAYDASKWEQFKDNTSIGFQFAFGQKSGGNWVAGKCGCLYLKECTISTFNLTDTDGLVTLELGLSAHVDSSGNPECFLNFL